MPLGIRFEDLQPAEVVALCKDPAFRALARWCLRDELSGYDPEPTAGSYDPLSDPLDDPLPIEGDAECPD